MSELYNNSESDKKKAQLLFLLTFVLSNKGYASTHNLLAPVLGKVHAKFPTPVEFKAVSNCKPHSHNTPLSTIICLHKDCLPQTTRAGLSAFVQVFSISNVIEFLIHLPGILKRKKSINQIINGLPMDSSARLALSVSTYVIIYKSLVRFFMRLFDPLLRKPSSFDDIVCSPLVPPFLAGLLAGPALLIDGDQPRRIMISVYILSKSLQFTYNALRQNRIIPKMPWWWGSWLLFPISSSQLISAYLLHPDIFPSSYDKFITSRSKIYINPRPSDFPDTMPWPTGREIVDRIAILSSLYFPEFYSPKLHGRDVPPLPDNLKPIQPIWEIAHPAHSKMMCAMLHHDEPSCLVTYTKFIAKEGVNSLKFMGMIYTISLLFRGKSLIERLVMKKIITQVLNNAVPEIFKGATFITMAIATAWALICGFQNVLPNKFMPISRIYLNGFISGLWVLVESPKRRLDIGMYSLRLSIELLWKLLVKKGKIRNIRNGEVIYFSLAMAMIMTIYKNKPKSISSPYIRIALSRLLGE
ncbi:14959_t:CDS:2 [Funneliformis mosseae]|uniref:14959_t:CDS:1 n=1 Tax=Funneliformis mosseae TaxID=27381 RepID=A0A9N9C3A4_FUNMO|nr:14959_t:CDS:2 [Funneliformis mosseae]